MERLSYAQAKEPAKRYRVRIMSNSFHMTKRNSIQQKSIHYKYCDYIKDLKERKKVRERAREGHYNHYEKKRNKHNYKSQQNFIYLSNHHYHHIPILTLN